MVGGNPETLMKMENSVRGHPKTSDKPGEFQNKGKTPRIFYAVAYGRKIGVFANKWSETENLTKHFKGARFRSFKVPQFTIQDAWIYILETNKNVHLPDSLHDYDKLSDSDITHFRNEMLKDKTAKDKQRDKTNSLNFA